MIPAAVREGDAGPGDCAAVCRPRDDRCQHDADAAADQGQPACAGMPQAGTGSTDLSARLRPVRCALLSGFVTV